MSVGVRVCMSVGACVSLCRCTCVCMCMRVHVTYAFDGSGKRLNGEGRFEYHRRGHLQLAELRANCLDSRRPACVYVCLSLLGFSREHACPQTQTQAPTRTYMDTQTRIHAYARRHIHAQRACTGKHTQRHAHKHVHFCISPFLALCFGLDGRVLTLARRFLARRFRLSAFRFGSACVCVCMYVCVCMCMCLCVTCVRVYARVCLCACVRTWLRVSDRKW